MKIGQVFRYGAAKDPTPELVDGFPNFWHATAAPGQPRAQLESGINPIAKLTGANARVPAVLISSSPHKKGSKVTPWEDDFDPDAGRVRYFGDSKVSKAAAPLTRGNKSLISAFELQSSSTKAERVAAPPLLLFKRVSRRGRSSGYVAFQGLGVIEAASLITQVDPGSGLPFTNFVFDIVVLDQRAENEVFDWAWISARRDSTVKSLDSLRLAPAAWQAYVKEGPASIPRLRRRAASLRIASKHAQIPSPGSPEEAALDEILTFYEAQKHRFEAAAEVVASRVLTQADGNSYTTGWVSRRGGDGGHDFVGRLNVGSGFAVAHLVVLGQAKCERSATSGRDIARTVARLRRGWVGCYVTTSYFSKPVQAEVIEDEYPIVLIHGARVARELLTLRLESGHPSLRSLLDQIDSTYESRLSDRDPASILHD